MDNNKITITICGDGGCGKSSITLRLVRSQWTHEYDPTIEDSYSITRRIDGQTYHLSLTDTAGQEEYRGMWASSNLRSDAFLLVYDITSRPSLEALQEFVDLIDMEAETREDARLRAGKADFVPPVKIIAGNKCDLQSNRQVPAQLGLEWARRHGCGFMETSARNTVNIEETFALIVRRVVEARRGGGMHEQVRKGSVVDERGTRRAVTAPLTPLPMPLPLGEEKESGFEDEEGPVKKEWFWRRWLRKLNCLRCGC